MAARVHQPEQATAIAADQADAVVVLAGASDWLPQGLELMDDPVAPTLVLSVGVDELRGWPRWPWPTSGVGTPSSSLRGPHLSYMGQWFIFAALGVAFHGALLRRTARGGSKATPRAPDPIEV